MARRAKRARARAATPRNISASGALPRQRIMDALMALLAEKPFEEVGLAEIAQTAGVTLAELRNEFGSTLAILCAQIKEIDRRVLAGGDGDMAEESARERLFDVLMRRLELLAPHREAVRSLTRSAARNPGLALALGCQAVRSQQWMLTAAGISASGPRGLIRAQGMACLYANVLRTWVDDDDPGLARTLAALDRELARGQRMAGLLDELCRIPEGLCRMTRRTRRSRRDRDEAAGAAGALG
jgi:AcrR family transcriptional regulator